MNVRKLLVVLAGAALAAIAAAQPDFDYNDGPNPRASVSQQIELTIPTRVALHITQTDFALDLNDLKGAGCRLVPKDATISNYQDLRGYANSGRPVSLYPAVVLDQNGNIAREGESYLKGTLVCKNTFVVQKFANTGWELTADVYMDPGSGKLGLRDDAPGLITDGSGESNYRHLIGASASGLMLAHSSSPTNGWLDDNIEQLFWFDGTETPGDKTITVTFVLTSKP